MIWRIVQIFVPTSSISKRVFGNQVMVHVPAEHFDGITFHLITLVGPGMNDWNVIAETTPEERKWVVCVRKYE